ncbi:hypothetical protein KO504_00900 [Winogradskyella psychrotolerans]|uniref:hypothetical protein n=1 Tax=Winogradskyella psychrotolerans TaxID=1344585 RepID=UPI001C07887E|nr:hypothetical protein [Winogradskyella psychrotolerans]MBU2919885.1 hypothetical protein [Winogradskyella psychrotolerans]
MKTATLFLALFMLLKPTIPFVEYAAFYDYIKNELCVNKDKPELACNGKCHLKKELAKASDSEKSNDKNHSSSTEHQVVFFQDIFDDNLVIAVNTEHLKIESSYNKIYKFDFMNFIFHPPLA